MLHSISNFLVYVAALFVASVRKLTRARGADPRTGNSKSPCCRVESDLTKYLIFKAYIYFFFISLYRAAFFVVSSLVFARRSLASVHKIG